MTTQQQARINYLVDYKLYLLTQLRMTEERLERECER